MTESLEVQEQKWRTFVKREEVWFYCVTENDTILSPLREGIDRLLPGDVIVDEERETIPMRPRDFVRAYPVNEWQDAEDEVLEALHEAMHSDDWGMFVRQHTLRIRPASTLYTDLLHVERDGQLVYDAEDPTKLLTVRQSDIDVELNEGGYVEVKE